MEHIIWNPFQGSQRRSDPSTKNISEVIVTVGTPKKSFYDKFVNWMCQEYAICKDSER